MPEQSNLQVQFVQLVPPMTRKQAKALTALRKASEEVSPICTQAPVIWDGKTHEDEKYAKKHCLGIFTKDEAPIQICPILSLCAQTAMIVEPVGGVWGGMTDLDRRRIRKELR